MLGGALQAAIGSSQSPSQSHQASPRPCLIQAAGHRVHACGSGDELCGETLPCSGCGAGNGTPGAGKASFSRDLGISSSPPSNSE